MSESGDDCALRHVSWNTQGSEPRHQFDFYRDGLCHAFAHLSPTNPSPKPEFLALIDTWASPRHAYTVMSAPSHLVSRTRADLAAAADNDYYLNFMLRGEMALAQHFGDTHLQAGEMMVVDNGHLYGARISAGNGHKHLAFRLARKIHRGWRMWIKLLK